MFWRKEELGDFKGKGVGHQGWCGMGEGTIKEWELLPQSRRGVACRSEEGYSVQREGMGIQGMGMKR